MTRTFLVASSALALALTLGCTETSSDPTSNTPELGGPSLGRAHFIKNATSCVRDGLNLVCTFKETGLESGSVETVTLAANATATYQCINGGGENPNDPKKTDISTRLSVSGTFSADKNGNIVGTLTLTPPGPGSFSCPPGQTVSGPTNVSYSLVVITDASSGGSFNVSGSF
jgi:hypothetical protein